MVKLATATLLAVLVCQGFSAASVQDGDIAKAAEAGDWEGIQRILKQQIDKKLHTLPSQLAQGSGLSYGSLPQQASGAITGAGSPGGRYYSQSEYSYQRTSNNNGVVSEDKGGLGMIDNNGRVSYYKPSPSSYAQAQDLTSAFSGASSYGQGR